MAVEYKDYYKILGVPRTASQDDIRKAFRKLAREHHPDVAKNKTQGEARFKEINEANEVLGDPEKRKKYDAMGENWRQGFPPPPGGGQYRRSQRPGGANGGEGFEFEFGGTGFSDFFEQFFGANGRAGGGDFGGFQPRGGMGADGAVGRGQDVEADLMVTLEEVMRGSLRQITLRRSVVCPKCGGSGYRGQKPCPECGASGQIAKTETHQVKIPAGIREGQKLRVSGKGEAGMGGGSAGDLFLRVRIASHPDFRVENGNLYYDLDLAPWEAALGTNVSVPTLENSVSIKIPPGTQGGQKMRVRGRGLPGRESERGDLVVNIHIQMPKQIGEKEKALWEQLAHESHFNPRA